MDRTILHCDCNGFFASAECLLHPEYRNVPMAVCGNPENRHGIILAKNELAKKYDIKTAETVWQARRKCPQLLLVPSHHELYRELSVKVNRIYARYTDMIEPFGIDESWLDVTGSRELFGDGKQIADTLRRVVYEELGITISVGVSFNKIFAKLGSDYKKPDATTVISRENYKDIVFPLSASDLLFVGKTTAEALRSMGIHTIGELAQCDRLLLAARLGKMGDTLYDYANGLDESPVRHMGDEQEIKSVGNGMTFKRNLLGYADIKTAVNVLADSVAARMRKNGVKCTSVQVMIRDTDFKTISRQKGVAPPTNLAKEIATAAMQLVISSWSVSVPIRMLTVTGQSLVPAESEGEQLSLFSKADAKKREKREKLEYAVDDIRGKFGKGAIALGSVINNDIGVGGGDGDTEYNIEKK